MPITASWALLGKFAMHLPRGCQHYGQTSVRIGWDHVLGRALHDWPLHLLILPCWFSACYETHTHVKEMLTLPTIGSHTLAYGFQRLCSSCCGSFILLILLLSMLHCIVLLVWVENQVHVEITWVHDARSSPQHLPNTLHKLKLPPCIKSSEHLTRIITYINFLKKQFMWLIPILR